MSARPLPRPRGRRVTCAAAGALLLLAAPASAHIQVRPALAAPGDPVLWTVLVPSEQESGTRQVELAIPRDVLPFSYEAVPGWTRRVRANPDGSVASIVWRGRTPGDGLAAFRFLASTPERDGPIAWKAIQTYADGAVVRWIGSPRSDAPASITTISSSAARENAGGESGDGAAVGERPAAAAAGDGPDWLARGLALAALLAGGLALLRRGRPRRGADDGSAPA